MDKTTFKFSALALSIFAVTNAHAALYKIEEISTSGTEGYGVAISADGTQVGVETRQGSDGFPFKDEAPFAFDNRFRIIEEDQNNQRDLYYYCRDERGYKSCENWASTQWYGINGLGGLRAEREAYFEGYDSNAKAFVNGTRVFETAPAHDSSVIDGTFTSNSTNVTITKVADDGTPLGTTSSGYYESNGTYRLAYRERGYYGTTVLLPNQGGASLVKAMGRSMAFDSFEYEGITYAVGSASVSNFDTSDSNKDYEGDIGNCVDADKPANYRECQHVAFATKPYFWDLSSAGSSTSIAGKAASAWPNNEANRNNYTAIGSVRGATIANSGKYVDKPVLVGFNSVRPNGDNNLGMQAGVFRPEGAFDITDNEPWTFVSISGAEIYNGDDYIFSNSRATDINTSLVAVGEAKLRNNRALNGALANRLFWTNANASTPSANFFSGGIFFSGAGGTAAAINENNLVVGTIDAETDREDGGKQRRRRGYIYPMGDVTGNNANADTVASTFDDQAWWIDDLTDSDDAIGEANNSFRIIDAGDINDDGVIMATAIKCEGGYDTRSHNSYCGGGTQTEKVVAVKLTPLTGSENTGITPRGGDSSPVERQGAGLGLWILALFGILGFRKRQ